MEMHIVSMNLGANKDKLLAAVTGIIFEGNATERSFADDFFVKLIKGEEINLSKDFSQFLNINQRYQYIGSLTSPPFSEPLFWTVISTVYSILPSTLELLNHTVNLHLDKGHCPPIGSSNRHTFPIGQR
jgi:carbonic anhydrase